MIKTFKSFTFFLITLNIFLLFSCEQNKEQEAFINENVEFASQQYGLQTTLIEESGEVLNPKTFIDGKIRYIQPREWTSGFFPGSMWYMFELTGDSKWKDLGKKYTEAIEEVKNLTSHHDVGL